MLIHLHLLANIVSVAVCLSPSPFTGTVKGSVTSNEARGHHGSPVAAPKLAAYLPSSSLKITSLENSENVPSILNISNFRSNVDTRNEVQGNIQKIAAKKNCQSNLITIEEIINTDTINCLQDVVHGIPKLIHCLKTKVCRTEQRKPPIVQNLHHLVLPKMNFELRWRFHRTYEKFITIFLNHFLGKNLYGSENYGVLFLKQKLRNLFSQLNKTFISFWIANAKKLQNSFRGNEAEISMIQKTKHFIEKFQNKDLLRSSFHVRQKRDNGYHHDGYGSTEVFFLDVDDNDLSYLYPLKILANIFLISLLVGLTFAIHALPYVGRKGEKGAVGWPGWKGYRGHRGIHGDAGTMGDKGLKGYAGDPGYMGYKGKKGSRGHQGDRGERGRKGKDGKKGAKGYTGIPGNYGHIGDYGHKGCLGQRGPTGYPGFIFYDKKKRPFFGHKSISPFGNVALTSTSSAATIRGTNGTAMQETGQDAALVTGVNSQLASNDEVRGIGGDVPADNGSSANHQVPPIVSTVVGAIQRATAISAQHAETVRAPSDSITRQANNKESTSMDYEELEARVQTKVEDLVERKIEKIGHELINEKLHRSLDQKFAPDMITKRKKRDSMNFRVNENLVESVENPHRQKLGEEEQGKFPKLALKIKRRLKGDLSGALDSRNVVLNLRDKRSMRGREDNSENGEHSINELTFKEFYPDIYDDVDEILHSELSQNSVDERGIPPFPPPRFTPKRRDLVNLDTVLTAIDKFWTNSRQLGACSLCSLFQFLQDQDMHSLDAYIDAGFAHVLGNMGSLHLVDQILQIGKSTEI